MQKGRVEAEKHTKPLQETHRERYCGENHPRPEMKHRVDCLAEGGADAKKCGAGGFRTAFVRTAAVGYGMLVPQTQPWKKGRHSRVVPEWGIRFVIEGPTIPVI